MKRQLIYLNLIAIFGIVLNINAQTCNSKEKEEESLEDLNSITKCSVAPTASKDPKGKTAVLKVKVSASKARFLKKRNNVSLTSRNAKIIKSRSNLSALTRILSTNEIHQAKKFVEVDKLPGFEKCGSTDDATCFNTEMINHINKYFYYPVESIKKKIQGKIWVRFIVDSKGNVGHIKTLGDPNVDTKDLEEVAKYVVAKLPNFKPAIKDGKPVPVKYGFPIDFSLEE